MSVAGLIDDYFDEHKKLHAKYCDFYKIMKNNTNASHAMLEKENYAKFILMPKITYINDKINFDLCICQILIIQ